MDADAAVCDACGMPASVLTSPALKPPPEPPPIPEPNALTGPALRPAPEPPAVTAPTLRPPPEPPPPDPNAGPSVGSGNPLMSGRLPAVPAGPGIAAGDPLAGMGSGDPLAAAPPPVVPSPAAAAPPVVPSPHPPADAAPPPAPEPAPEPAAPEPPAPAEPPHEAHPSDETPPGYVTAASLWKISSPRPDWDTGEKPADIAQPDATPREAAAAAQRAPEADRPPGYAETRHGFPALAPQETTQPKKRAAEPVNPNRSRIDGKTAGIVAAIVLLAAIVTTAVVVLTGGDEPKQVAAPVDTPVATTPEPTPKKTPKPKATAAPIEAQVKTLDELVRFSAKGRKSAVSGDMKAAIANRSKLLKDIRALDKQADDKQLKAALVAFDAAITESLRQNRECASKCSDADLQKVGKLKTAALAKINPILKEHGGRTYKREEI
ncbi:hypothetical protein [Solirubrobacter soli]|uniref:hypothetical protein n=1 Tax=Solirubrobacter soli TaxID=363832 RepID=UPI0012F760BE|nr:hypothetical protein [Solirubrobacter soli]